MIKIKTLVFALISGIMIFFMASYRNSRYNETIVTVHPKEINAPLTNPYMGWGMWLGNRYFDGRLFSTEYNTTGFGDSASLFSWAVVDWMWADLEPENDKFYWAQFDSIINYWKDRDKQFLIRLWVTDDPGWDGAPGSTACPDWLWEKGVKYREYKGEGNSIKKEPDYTDPSFNKVYIPYLKSFLQAFADRYQGKDNNMTMFQVMGYGQWGEWHTLWSKYPWPDKHKKHEVLSSIIKIYMEIFDSTQLVIANCFDSDMNQVSSVEDYKYRQATDLAIANNFGLSRHGFIDGLHRWDKLVMENHWKHCPLIAEGNWSYSDVKNHGTHGSMDQNLDRMLEWHSIYAHFYTDAESYRRFIKEDKRVLERGLMAGGLGYRFVISSASWDREISAGRLLVMKQDWVNLNVGWCMKNFRLKTYLTDKEGNEKFSDIDYSFDNTRWYKGEVYHNTTSVFPPKTLPPGEYDLRIAMVDEKGKPAVKLAIEGMDKQGRYKLGTIKIKAVNPKDKVF